MLGLALALTSSLFWGIADFIGGVQARRLPVLRVVLVSQGASLIVLALVLAVRAQSPPSLGDLAPAAGGGVLGIFALVAFYRALAIGTMSIVAPVAATGVAVPVIVGLAGGDSPAPVQLVGMAAAVVGVVLASREEGGGRRRGGSGAGRGSGARSAGIALALVAAVGFGTFFVGLRESARADVLWALFAARFTSVAALLAIVAGLRVPGVFVSQRLVLLATIGMLDLLANGLFATATRHGLLSIVAVGGSLYPLATVLLARLVLGERVRRSQEVGIVAAIAGVAMIAAGP